MLNRSTRDAAAVRFIMGHADDANDMSAHYRERISDERLRAVTDHIHAWLFEGEPAPPLKLANVGEEEPHDQPRAEAAV